MWPMFKPRPNSTLIYGLVGEKSICGKEIFEAYFKGRGGFMQTLQQMTHEEEGDRENRTTTEAKYQNNPF